jgi:hypothetical protein
MNEWRIRKDIEGSVLSQSWFTIPTFSEVNEKNLEEPQPGWSVSGLKYAPPPSTRNDIHLDETISSYCLVSVVQPLSDYSDAIFKGRS